MKSKNIEHAATFVCSLTYSEPFQKTIIKMQGEENSHVGFFDRNFKNAVNFWNFRTFEGKNLLLNGKDIVSIELQEQGRTIFFMDDNGIFNALNTSSRLETARMHDYADIIY